ncbi:MAG: DUF308 domain-containing protein [Erythrobacter sp.]|nr:DUF308 domain-containing protein [Erythrobacter sp.]
MANAPQPTTRTVPEGRSSAGRIWFIILGALFILTGAAAIIFPLVASLSLNLVAGVALLTAGLFTLVHAFRNRGWRGFAAQVALGLLYTVGGALFLFNPLAGMVALAILLGALFAADGVARIAMALRIRPDRSWWIFLISGLLSLILGALVLLGLPSGLSLAFLGIVFGINLILTGASFIACSGEDSSCEPGTLPGTNRDKDEPLTV